MKIAINTRFLIKGKMEGFGWYTYEISKRLCSLMPEHQFFFFFDRAFDEEFIFADNVTPVVINPPARHPILFSIWFNFSVKRALKKHQIDLFFSPDGYASLTSDVKQLITIHDLNFEHNSKDLPASASKYLRKNFPKFARKADHILTVSNYSKSDIQNTYGIKEEKITSVWNGASDLFKPVVGDELVQLKKKWNEGRPYFLFVGSLHPRKNVRRLIEAYDQYSKQKENTWDLVIVGEELWSNMEGFKLSASLKNRVKFTGRMGIEDLTEVMAASDAFVYVPYFEGFGIPIVEAMKCGIPIISGDKTSLPEVAGDAALYCDPFDVSSIAEAMRTMALDDALRNDFAAKSLDRGKEFSWDKSALQVKEVIERML